MVVALLTLFVLSLTLGLSAACNGTAVQIGQGCYTPFALTTGGAFDVNTTAGSSVLISFSPSVYYSSNPTAVSFALAEASCSVSLKGLYTCSSACGWADVEASSSSLNVSFFETLSQCGCSNISTAGFHWLLRVDNTDSINCTVSLQVTVEDYCNAHGHYVNGSQLVPPSTSAPLACYCHVGWEGDFCEQPMTARLSTTPFNVTLTDSTTAVTQYFADEPAFYIRNYTVKSLTTSCNDRNVTVRLNYDCGGCLPGYPTSTTSSVGARSVFQWAVGDSFSFDDLTDSQQQCGCGNTAPPPTWSMLIEDVTNTPLTQTCIYTVIPHAETECALNSNNVVCGGEGECVNSLCSCNRDLDGLACDQDSTVDSELYNTLLLAQTFTPLGAHPHNAHVAISPHTNKQITISLKPTSGKLSTFLTVAEGVAHGDSSSSSNAPTLVSYTGDLLMFLRFGKAPEFTYVHTPLQYPNILVQVNVTTAKYDLMLEGTNVNVTIPLNKSVATHLYIAVVGTGSFNAITSKPALEPGIEFQLKAVLQDDYATMVDSILLSLFLFLVLFFCVSWKATPTAFHAVMRRIVPELYHIDPKVHNTTPINTKALSQELGKIAQYLTLPSMAALLALLLEAMPNVSIPLSFKTPTVDVDALLKELPIWIEKVQVPMLTIPNINGLVPPQVVIKMVDLVLRKIPDIDLTKIRIPILDPHMPRMVIEALSVSYMIPNIPNVQIPVLPIRDLLFTLCTMIPDVPSLQALAQLLKDIPTMSLPIVPIDSLNLKLSELIALIQQLIAITPNLPKAFIEAFMPLAMELKALDVELNIIIPDVVPSITVKIPEVKISDLVTIPLLAMPEMPLVPLWCHCNINLFTPRLALVLEFILGALLVIFFDLFISLIDLLTLLFNISIMHLAFLDIHLTIPGFPTVQDIIDSFQWLIGDLAQLVNMVPYLFSWADLFSWTSLNCGGELTLASPFLFFVGAIFVWIVLQKDLLLWLGIKLRLHKAKQASTLLNKVLQGASLVMVKVTVFTVQAVIMVLAKAATTASTKRSCNEIDFVANSFGRIIVAFFYVFFYVMFFFIFTGAPDWDKYRGMNWKKSVFLIFWDGIQRFMSLTAGVWTDANVRAYNIIGRADRYLDDAVGASTQRALLKVGLLTGPDPATVSATQSLMLHENIMHLIAASRTVVWIPLPLCVCVTKVSEALNQANVFVFTKQEHLVFRRSIRLRIFIWICNVVQSAFALGVVFTAKKLAVAVCSGTIIPLYFVRVIPDLAKVGSKFGQKWSELSKVAEVDLKDVRASVMR